MKQTLLAYWDKLADIAAQSYIVGASLDDALRVRRLVGSHGWKSTLCYWRRPNEAPGQVASACLEIINALGKEHGESWLSLKAHAIHYDREALLPLFRRGQELNVPVCLDADTPEAAQGNISLISDVSNPPPGSLICTLASRWPRSLKDADWTVERKLPVRIVKGQLPDPSHPNLDLRETFLAVTDRLAGRSPHVAIATHDAPLARAAIERLLRTGTSCEIELLYGLPLEPARQVAKDLGVGIRFYIPYGHGALPYWLSQARQKPEILGWIVKDLCGKPSGRLPRF